MEERRDSQDDGFRDESSGKSRRWMRMSHTWSATFEISNKLGLHARPASLFVQAASGFDCEIQVENLSTSAVADGKSMMSMLMLAAACGTSLKITAEGSDAECAVKTLGGLVSRGFDEE